MFLPKVDPYLQAMLENLDTGGKEKVNYKLDTGQCWWRAEHLAAQTLAASYKDITQ